MIRFTLLLLFAMTAFTEGFSQVKLSIPEAAASVTVPEGWTIAPPENGYALMSADGNQVIIITTNAYTSQDQMISEAAQSTDDGNGTQLTITGTSEKVGTTGVFARFSGYINWSPAKGAVAAVMNPNGFGLTFTGVSTPETFTPALETTVRSLISKTQFQKLTENAEVTKWKGKLKAARLTHIESYNAGFGSGGSSTEEVLSLCENGRYYLRSSSMVSMSGGDVSGSSGGNSSSRGAWSVQPGPQNTAWLVLVSEEGETMRMQVHEVNGGTYLDQTRWYRTYASDGPGKGPECN